MGDETLDYCAIAGLILDPWQEITLRIWLGLRSDGKWAHRRNALEVPRQDGKGAILEARQIGGLFVVESDRLIIHTAHEFKTAEESFGRLASLLEDSKLRHQLKTIRTGRGQEAIILRNGKRVRFLARSPRSGRGFSSDLLIYDEAMDGLTPRMVGASGPTQSARPNPQTIYTATAGDDSSEVLAKVREEGIEGTPRLSYIEYAAGDRDNHSGEGIDLDDRREWYRANPAMWGDNPRMTLEAVEEDRRMMDEENFARERLCLWWTGKRVSIIDPDLWESLIGDSTASDPICFAVDAPPGKEHVSIGVAGRRPDGKTHLELVEYRMGTAWVVPRQIELAKRWKPAWVALSPGGPAGSFVDEIKVGLEGQRVPVLSISGGELKQACGAFLDRVTERQVAVQRSEHTNVLASAVDALRKREFPEGGFVFHRRDTAADISPVMALVLASYALGKPPKKKPRSGEARF